MGPLSESIFEHLRKWISLSVLLGSILGLLACSSSGSNREFIPELDGNNSAPGAAFTADGMHFRKEMPLHKDWRPLEFYFKQCAQIDEKPYYSKTAYECSKPY